MYTTTPPTQLLCSCVRCDQGRRASQLCRCGQSVGRWCSKGKRGSVFSFFRSRSVVTANRLRMGGTFWVPNFCQSGDRRLRGKAE